VTITGEALEPLLQAMWDLHGTDLILTAGTWPLIRVDGALRPVVGTEPLSPKDSEGFARDLLSLKQWDTFESGNELDFSFTWKGTARIRGNAFRQKDCVAVALRMIPREIPSFHALGLPESLRRFATLQQGLVLVTGPTGSGKSTTLASIIDWINTNRAVHVITIEDPIEYVHEHKQAAISQREVGTDTESFSAALRNALREDPDVLLIGEMRDLESMRSALTLAETGHLVFATLHTNDSVQAVDRMIDVFPGDQQPQIRVQLASALTGIAYQRLLPRIDGGQVAAFEVLVANAPVRNLIKEGRTNQLRNQILTGQRDGMQTLEMSMKVLIDAGLLARDEAASRSLHPTELGPAV
jgi:twitching motility protein PilT